MPGAQILPPGRRNGGSADVRHQNLVRILRYVRDHGPSSRHDIAQGCGLGVSTMTDLIGELRSRRLVKELGGVPRPGAGRPTRPIAMDGEPWCVIGVQADLLDVHFLCSTVGGEELWSTQVPARLLRSGAEAGYPLLGDALSAQLHRIPEDKTLVAVQVALPGYVATDRGTVGWSDSLGWGGMALQSLVSDTLTLAGRPGVAVGIAHDCHLAALHAVREELPAPMPRVAAYLGGLREVGGGVVVDGGIFRGADGGAGDFGHANIDPRGPECPCGRHGCLESLIGPTTLLTASGLRSAAEADQLVTEDPVKALQVLVQAAEAREERVLDKLDQAGDSLGIALDDIIATLNDVVILGGYLGVLSPYLLAASQKRIAHRITIESFAATTVVALEQLRSRALAGAAVAARDACLHDPLTLTGVVLDT